MSDLKKSKLIKVEGDGGVDTIRAEIPFEARNAFLERTRRQIFVSGMGVDPNPENFGNSSGVALKYLYSLLELKAGMMETQFRSGFAELVRAICRLEGIAQPKRILQTWTRNMVQNDLETAQIAQQSVGIISDRTILANHPWVDDAESEQKQLEKEQQAAAEKQPQFQFPPRTVQAMAAADKLNGVYWRKRAIELAEKQKQEDDDLCLRFHREYERILHELDKEISIFYARYAANESVSMAEAGGYDSRLLRKNGEISCNTRKNVGFPSFIAWQMHGFRRFAPDVTMEPS